MDSMTVRSVCLRHLPGSTEHPKPFDAGLVKIGSCQSAPNCELLIIGMSCWIQTCGTFIYRKL
jgi:hypothetical protein